MNNVVQPVLVCRNLAKSYSDGVADIDVLQDIDLSVQPGEMVAIVGSSGSGKSTLLHLLGGLDKPTKGQVLLNNYDLQTLPEYKKFEFHGESKAVAG
jgi:lipoprotein-releasing system ATP-binding protein